MKQVYLNKLADSEKAVVVLSGGMDSTIAARLCVEKYGAENVHALSYYYQQKQSSELEKAKVVSTRLGFYHNHKFLDISFLGDMARGISANIQGGKPMPTIQDIIGDPTPPTYVPNRNAILMMIAAGYAETIGAGTVVLGLQNQDQYGYHDTTPAFVDSINGVLNHARVRKVQVSAPFLLANKTAEIELLMELDGDVDLLSDTVTCYNPIGFVGCGKCPSCSERIQAFVKAGIVDPVRYNVYIPWKELF